jgi:hypothetical protein
MAPNPTYIIGMSAPLSRLASSLFLLFVACAEGQGPTGQDLGPPDLGAPDAEGADASDAGALPDDTGAVTLDAGELDAQSRDVPALDPTRFGPTAGLATARSSHSATLLADGRVLVVGGFGATGRPLASTELYDPQTGQWSPGPTLDQARANHLALRLPSGQVIIAGGGLDNNVGAPAGRGILASVVLFDSTNGDLVPAAPLTEGRSHAAATLLEDGRVLVVGGSSGTRTTQPNYGDALGNSEIYEPAADRWSPGPPLNTPRYLHSLLPLSSGEVAVIGGSDPTEAELLQVEILQPNDGSRRDGPNLTVGRVFQAAAPLASGRGLIVCGKQANIRFLNSAEILEADGAGLSAAPPLPGESRTAPTLSPLQSGHLLLAGGLHGSSAGFHVLADAYLFDETGPAWTAITPLAQARVLHTATVLSDGSVLVCGGLSDTDTLSSCERSEH